MTEAYTSSGDTPWPEEEHLTEAVGATLDFTIENIILSALNSPDQTARFKIDTGHLTEEQKVEFAAELQSILNSYPGIKAAVWSSFDTVEDLEKQLPGPGSQD